MTTALAILAAVALALGVISCEDNDRPVPYDELGRQIDDGSGRGAISM